MFASSIQKIGEHDDASANGIGIV